MSIDRATGTITKKDPAFTKAQQPNQPTKLRLNKEIPNVDYK